MTTTTRRTAADRQADRDALLASLGEHFTRVPAGTPRSDVDALVREGLIETEVRREWDSQRGFGGNLFGGAGVCQRKRLYARRVPTQAPKAAATAHVLCANLHHTTTPAFHLTVDAEGYAEATVGSDAHFCQVCDARAEVVRFEVAAR